MSLMKEIEAMEALPLSKVLGDALNDLVEGMFDGTKMASADIAMSLYSGPLANRRYGSLYEPPRLLTVDDVTREKTMLPPPSRTPSRRSKIRLVDSTEKVAGGAAAESHQQTADGSVVTTLTDSDQNTLAELQEAYQSGAKSMRASLKTSIFGAREERQGLINSLANTIIVLLMEPFRIKIDLQMTLPSTDDAMFTLKCALFQSTTTTQADDVVRTHVSSLTFHLFGDCPELGMRHRHVSTRFLRGCQILTNFAARLFDPKQCEITPASTVLTGFLHNARLAQAMDRGRLIGSVASSLISSQPTDKADFLQTAMIMAVTNAQNKALELTKQSGERFATRAAIKTNCDNAIAHIAACPLPPRRAERPVGPTLTMDGLMALIAAKY